MAASLELGARTAGMSDRAAARRDRFATLDLLRLVAALAVLCFHYLYRGAAGEAYLDTAFPEAAPVAIYGYLGVHLFFLISGFVIAWSAEGRDWQSFAIARFARIYPGFLVCMAITFAVLWFAADPRLPASPAQFAANLLILSPALGQPFMDGVYWSIVLELVFYGWVALALILGIFDRWKLALVAGWLTLSALNEFFIGSGAVRMLFITEYAPWFASGILLQHLCKHGRSTEALLLAAASFLLSCNMLVPGQLWMLEHYGEAIALPNLLAANTALHLVAILAIRFRGAVPATPLVLALGGITYPLYLLHQHIGYVALNEMAPVFGRWAALALVIAAMLALSYSVWKYVERPARPAVIAALAAAMGRLRPPFARRARAGAH